MKQLHEKQLHEYNEDDHYKMAIWHLRRCGIHNFEDEKICKEIMKARQRMKEYMALTKNVNLYENLYGCFVKVNDRFETILKWDEKTAIDNNGKFVPKPLTNYMTQKKMYNQNLK